MGSLPNLLLGREANLGPRTLECIVTIQRCSQLKLSRQHQLDTSSQTGGIMWLDLDQSERRYLLAAAADATIAVYDTQAWASDSKPVKRLKPTCLVSRNHAGVHQYLVSSVAWYPHDTGMFVSGGYDHTVKLWDTNQLEVACSWPLPAKVSCVALSSMQEAQHCLVAAACLDPALKLCDPRTGAFTHTLVGHRHPIWSVSWSLHSPHELVSGDAYGQVCIWDVRRFGPQHVLDQYCTQRRPPAAATTTLHSPPTGGNTQAGRGDQASSGPTELAAGKARAASTPANLADAVSSAWEVVETQLPQRSRSSLPTSGAPAGVSAAGSSMTGKRARSGEHVASTGPGPTGTHPVLRDLLQPAGSGSNRAHRQSSTQHASQQPQQQAAAVAPRDPFYRLPLSASAPGHRPGRVGDAIGGRAPSGRLRETSTGVDADRVAGAAGSGLVDEHVRAHQGSVTCVLPTPDGLGWLTSGTDSRLHLWDAMLWHHRIVGFTDTFNRAIRGRRLAVTQDGRVVFHPCGSSVQVFNVQTGQLLADLEQGHTESINACAWNGLLGQLYTAANDSCISVWEVPDGNEQHLGLETGEGNEDQEDQQHDRHARQATHRSGTSRYGKGSSGTAHDKRTGSGSKVAPSKH